MVPQRNMQTFNEEDEMLVQFPKFPLTAFGDVRTAELTPIFQGSFEYTVDNTEIVEKNVTASATVTQAQGMAVLTTTTTTGGRASLQSKTHARYKAGFGGLGRFTSLFTAGVAGTSQWAGVLDEVGSSADFKNGYAIGFNGTQLCVGRFQNDVLFAVNREDWNDPLDGTGSSRMTIDITKINVFEIRFQYLGGGAIEFCIEDDSTGRFFVFHKILYANLNIVPSSFNPNFHIFLYVNNKATTSNIILKSASFGYFIEGKSELAELQQPQFSSGVITKATVTAEVALLTIKCKDIYQSKTNFIPVLLEFISASIEASSPNNLGTVRLVKNATLGGSPSYTDISASNSVVSIDIAGTTITGGREIMSIQLANKNDRLFQLVTDLKIILQDGDTLTLAVSSVASATFKGSLLWKELF